MGFGGFGGIFIHLKVVPSFLPKTSNFCVNYPQFHLNLDGQKTCVWFCEMGFGLVWLHFYTFDSFQVKSKSFIPRVGDTHRVKRGWVHLGMMSHTTPYLLAFGMLVVSPNTLVSKFMTKDRIIYIVLLFMIHLCFFFPPFQFNFWNYMVDWYMLGYHVDGLQLINSLEVGPQKDLQTFVNTFSLKCSNVSSTFSTLVFDTPCHMPPPPSPRPESLGWHALTYAYACQMVSMEIP